MDTEEILIGEIRSLFEQLIETRKGKIVSGEYIIEPDNYTYTQLAKELINKAHKLSKLNSQYDTFVLNTTLGREIKLVELYKYEYDKNKKTKRKSINELQTLMHNATKQIKSDLWSILKDIEL